ncbi:MAG: TetR/AcrR family transcriptional regulator [Acidimicrobiales bacterium]
MAAAQRAPEVERPKHRAAALPPDERRAVIASAALSLLLEHGTNITTRQIAEAANIAEGTTFRVFPDKDAIIRAAVDLAFDPAPVRRAIGGIDRSLPFEGQLIEAVEIIQRRMLDIGRLVSAVGGPFVFADGARPIPDLSALTELLAVEEASLRYDAEKAARLLPALILAFSHPLLHGQKPMSASEIVTILLDGIRLRGDAIAKKKSPRC